MLVELFLIAVVVFLGMKFNQKPKGIPPGEWGLPIVGYIPFMNLKLVKTLHKLEKKHGRIFRHQYCRVKSNQCFCLSRDAELWDSVPEEIKGLKLGSKLLIVLSDYNLVKIAFSKKELSRRPITFSFKAFFHYIEHGIIACNGSKWEANRKFAMRTLKEFGLGKSKLEEFILVEAKFLVNTLKKSVDKSITVDWNLNVAVVNVLLKLVANRRYDINDEELKQFTQNIYENVEDMEGIMAIFNLLPWLETLIPKFVKDSWMKVGVVRERRQTIEKFLKGIIKEHKESLDPNNPKDFIDQYLIEVNHEKNNLEYSHREDIELYAMMFDLFAAGSDTTSATLRWFFIYMAKYQDIQKRVQQEIDEMVSRDRLPSLQDNHNLPCLEALLHEINRKISLLANGIPHEATEDVTLGGYLIPKGAIVMHNTESCHRDERYWNNPNEFSLEHFLDKEGKFVAQKESYMPFSLGRRQCVGKSLAEMELFLFMGAILQNFTILEPDGQSLSLESQETINISNYPKSFKIVLKSRD